MRKSDFQEFCKCVRKAWTRKSGVRVVLYCTKENDDELLQCAGAQRNPGLAARNCVVWNGEECLYSGALDSDEVKKLLEKLHVCGARVGTIYMISRGRKGVPFCIDKSKQRKQERCASCPAASASPVLQC